MAKFNSNSTLIAGVAEASTAVDVEIAPRTKRAPAAVISRILVD